MGSPPIRTGPVYIVCLMVSTKTLEVLKEEGVKIKVDTGKKGSASNATLPTPTPPRAEALAAWRALLGNTWVLNTDPNKPNKTIEEFWEEFGVERERKAAAAAAARGGVAAAPVGAVAGAGAGAGGAGAGAGGALPLSAASGGGWGWGWGWRWGCSCSCSCDKVGVASEFAACLCHDWRSRGLIFEESHRAPGRNCQRRYCAQHYHAHCVQRRGIYQACGGAVEESARPLLR